MRKILIAGAVVAAGAIGYVATQNQGGSGGSNVTALDYVPADTLVFSGQLEPFPVKDYLKNLSFAQTELPPELIESLSKEDKPQAKFFLSLLNSYSEATVSADAFLTTFGMPDMFEGAFYNIGFMPVFRYKAKNPEAILALFDKAEADSGLKHELRTLKDQAYRAYVLQDPNRSDVLEILVAEKNGWVTMTFATQFNEPADIEVALGITKPTNPIAATKILPNLVEQYGFLPHNIGYIDHVGIVKAVTTEDGNATARMITKALDESGDTDALAEARSEACSAEFSQIANNWPRTVIGMTEMDIVADRTSMKVSTVFESKSAIMPALKSLQGFLPSYLQERTVFGMGLAVDANQLNQALSKIWTSSLEPEYQCPPLQQFQADLRNANPASLAIVTGFVQGLKGIGVAVNEFKLDGNSFNPQIQELDTIISLSADDPKALFNVARNFLPPLAAIPLPKEGESVDLSQVLPLPPGFNVKPQLALYNNHLVIYTGDKSKQQAQALSAETLKENGFLNFSMDYKAMLSELLPIIEAQAAAEPELASQLETLKDLDMWVKGDLFFEDDGIKFLTELAAKAPKSAQ